MKKSLKGILLDILIILLSISMLNLVFMHAARSIASYDDNKPIFNDLWIIQGHDKSSFSAFDISMCMPDMIVYKQPLSKPRAVYDDSELMKIVYSVLSNVITDVFGIESIAEKAEGDTSEYFKSVTSAENFLLFSYPSELPYPCLYAYSTGSNTVTYDTCSRSDAFYVSDIALILDEKANDISYQCIVFDKSGNAYEFSREDGNDYILPASDRAHLEAYAEKFNVVDFTVNSTTLIDKFQPHPLDILYGGFEFSRLAPVFSIASLELDNEERTKELLDIFDINPEKINKYTESNGTTIFIGTDDRLEISSDGILSFINSNSPVEIKEIIGFSPSKIDSYTVFDMLKSINVIIKKLTDIYPNFFGGVASPKLTAVYKDAQERSVFEYSYYINGTRVNVDPSLKFAFTSNGLAEFSADITAYEQTSNKSATLPKLTVYERLSEVNSLPPWTTLTPIYTKKGDELDILWWSSIINTNSILS